MLLPQETHTVLVVKFRRQYLDRNMTSQFRLLTFIDDAESATADLASSHQPDRGQIRDHVYLKVTRGGPGVDVGHYYPVLPI